MTISEERKKCVIDLYYNQGKTTLEIAKIERMSHHDIYAINWFWYNIIGMDEWFINSMMELFDITRAGYVSDVSSAIEEVTGKKPINFSQFAKDYSRAFK